MRRAARILAWTLLVLIGLPLLLAGAVWVAANTDPGRELIEHITARLSNGSVQLQGLSGSLPDRLRVRRLTIADPQGPWLQADDLTLDWSPLKLLSDRVDIARLTAARILAWRRPHYPPGRAARRGAADQLPLPLTIQIDQLRLPSVELAAALAGNTVAVRVQGGGRYRSLQRAALQLTVQRLDRLPATYLVSAQLTPRRVQISLDVAEQAGGPMANLMVLPGLGALSVHLQLHGPRDALAVQLDAQAGGLEARAGGTVDLPDRAGTLDVDLSAPAMAPRPGLTWQQVSLQVHARGAFTAPSTSAQLHLVGLTVGSLHLNTLQATLHGEGQGIGLDALLDGLTLPAPIDTLLQSAPVQLHGQARVTGLTGVALDLSLVHPLLNAQAYYRLNTMRLGPRPAGRAARLRAAAGTNSGTITVRLPDLAPWAALAGLRLQGRAGLQGQMDLQPALGQLALSGVLEVSGGQAPLAQLLGPRSGLSAMLQFDRQGIDLERAQLGSARLQGSARGTDQHGRLAVSWQAALSDLTALMPGLPGRLSAQGRLQGTAPRLTFDSSADASFAVQRAAGALHMTLQASNLPQQPSGRLQVSGSLDQAPLTVEASAQSTRGQLTLRIEQGRWKSAQLQGALSIPRQSLSIGAQPLSAAQRAALRREPLSSNHAPRRSPQPLALQPAGELTFSVARLADIDALLSEPVQGSLTGRLDFERSGARSRARVTLLAHDLGIPAQRLTVLQLGGQIDQPLSEPRLALQLSAAAQIRGVGAKLSATATGPLDALQLHADGSTAACSERAVDSQTCTQLGTSATWNQARSALQLTALTVHYGQQRAHLLAPALLSFHNGISIDQLRIAVAPAVLQMQGQLAPQLDVRGSARDLTPAVLAIVMPQLRGLRPQGHAQADIQLRGTLAQPTGRFTFEATGLGSASNAIRGLPSGTIKVSAQLAADSVELHVAADAGQQMRLRIDGQVPLRRTLPIALKMTGTTDLNFANPIFEAGGQRVLGSLSVQADVSGTPAAPQARGQLTITGASFQDYARGLTVSDIDATLEAEGPELRLTHMSARAGSGTLSASGGIQLTAPGMPVQLTLSAHNAELLRSDLLTANLDMAVKLSGILRHRQLAATGTVRVNKATINIPNAMPPDVPVLHVVRPGQPLQPPPPATPLLAMLDLTVNAPTGIFVRGRGLNAEVGGKLRVSGSSLAPSISGGFDLINGTLDMAGSTLTFSSGRLSFNGTGLHNRIDPTLDFTATTYSGGITATLNVGGYADAPVITLSSTPALPQDEILARLLFGESVSQLSPLQIAGIGAALVTMTGVGGGGFNPLTTVQHALGLSRLVISSGTPSSTSTAPTGATSTQSNTGATIEAGRYVSNRIYVGAKQSTAGLTQAQVQVDLTHNWKLQTTLSTGGGTIQGATPENDPGSSVGMSYQFEY